MYRRLIALTTAATLALVGAASQPSQLPAAQLQPAGWVPLYRLLAVGSNDHVYTTDGNEIATLTQQGSHTYEGAACNLYASPLPGTVPLYRYVRADGTHLLDTQRPARGDPLARLEATLGYIAGGPAQGLVALNVWFHPQLGLFFYTTQPQGEFAPQNGYVNRGVLGFVAPG
jgi:hypothetical protein